MKIEIKYNKKANSVYLRFSEEKVAYSKKLDAERTVDYSEEGEIRGIQFLSAGAGLKTADLPYRSAIDSALYDKGIAESCVSLPLAELVKVLVRVPMVRMNLFGWDI